MALSDYKAQAHRLASYLASAGIPIKQSVAFEAIAASHGFRNWNTLHAIADKTQAEIVHGVAEREKARYELEGLEIPVWEAFESLLRTVPFLSPAAPDIAPVGLRNHRHIFILEVRIMEELRKVLRDDQGNLLGSENESVDRIIHKAIGRALVSAVTKQNWLQRKLLGPLGPEADFWRIRHGRRDFHGVMVLRLPPKYKLEQPNAPHQVDILEPQPPSKLFLWEPR